MDQQDVLIKVVECLNSSKKMVTLNKVASETGIDAVQVGEALETLSSKGLASKRTIEDFDESCYQANENTDVFCQKMLAKKAAAEPEQPSEETAVKSEASTGADQTEGPATTQGGNKAQEGDDVQAFLQENGADQKLIRQYEKLLSERDFFKRRVSIWEKHIGKMVDSVSKELSS